jgi:hypothetical protein
MGMSQPGDGEEEGEMLRVVALREKEEIPRLGEVGDG